MEHSRLGKSGLKVSALGLGTMTFGRQTDEKTAFSIMDEAWDAGVRLLDCADIYPLGGGVEMAGETERIVGKWLKAKPREQIVVTSKCFAQVGVGANDGGLSRQHILHAAEQSLRRLDTDHIDLYMAHSFSQDVEMEETLRAFEILIQTGKIRYVGVSNWDAWQIQKALGIQQLHHFCPLVSDQLRYNLLYRLPEEDTLFSFCQQEGIGLMAYNPLAGGMLTGRYRFDEQPSGSQRFNEAVGGKLYQIRYWNEALFAAVERYMEICRNHALDPVMAAVRFVLDRPQVSTVLLGASKPGQLTSALAAQEHALSREAACELDALWYTIPRRPDEQRH